MKRARVRIALIGADGFKRSLAANLHYVPMGEGVERRFGASVLAMSGPVGPRAHTLALRDAKVIDLPQAEPGTAIVHYIPMITEADVTDIGICSQAVPRSASDAAAGISARRPRVLFLVASDWYFYCHRLPLAQRIAAAGYDVHVATPSGRFCGAIKAAGLRHWPIQIDRQGRNPFKDLTTIKRLVRLYREIDPLLVHHVALKPIVYGSIAAKITKVPAIVNAMPGMGYIFLSKQLMSRLIRPAVKAAFRLLMNAPDSRVILQNPDDVRTWTLWRVIRPDRIVLIRGSGIDTSIYRPTPEPPGPPLVVLPARLLFFKGVGEFVDAARLLRRRGVSARFALVGEGDSGNPASVPSHQLRQWEKEGVIELFGWHDDMPLVLAQSHIVCLPSYGEGLPKALLEAAACGKPIVTTDVPGCRDVVRHGDNGLLVPARQSGPLADALARLIDDGDLRRSMAARSRERAVAEFSLGSIAAETLQLYAELLGTRKP